MCVSVLPFLPVVNSVPFLKLGYVSLVLIPGQKAIEEEKIIMGEKMKPTGTKTHRN